MWYLTTKSTSSIESLNTDCNDSNIDPSEGGVEALPKKKTPVRNPWTKEDLRQLKAHSKTRTPVVEVAKAMKRTEGRSGKRRRQSASVLVIAVEDARLDRVS